LAWGSGRTRQAHLYFSSRISRRSHSWADTIRDCSIPSFRHRNLKVLACRHKAALHGLCVHHRWPLPCQDLGCPEKKKDAVTGPHRTEARCEAALARAHISRNAVPRGDQTPAHHSQAFTIGSSCPPQHAQREKERELPCRRWSPLRLVSCRSRERCVSSKRRSQIAIPPNGVRSAEWRTMFQGT
jgi:hypothetical protein